MMQIFPIFFIDLKDPYFKVERVTENVRFGVITSIIHGQIDLLTPFDLRAQTFFRAKGSLSDIFQNSF